MESHSLSLEQRLKQNKEQNKRKSAACICLDRQVRICGKPVCLCALSVLTLISAGVILLLVGRCLTVAAL